MLKIACYGVRNNEQPYFNELNKYEFSLTLWEDLLTHDNISTFNNHDAVLLRGNCVADKQNLLAMKEAGIKYVFTRTVGFNHIDVEEAKKLGMTVARVPSYSPNAIAELSLSLAMSLLRQTTYTASRTKDGNFIVDSQMFCKEVRNCKVGIIGLGKIGLTEAKLFKGLGAELIGYDPYPSEAAKEIVTFKTQDELLAECDIISIHVPLIPGVNEKMINDEFIGKMKEGAILINTARGELQDNTAIYNHLISNKLKGFGTDVMPNEKDLFFKDFGSSKNINNEEIRRLVDLYPKVLITPHVGSNTDEALTNMIETSFDNFFQVTNNQVCENIL